MKSGVRFVPMLCLMGLIFFLSHQPGGSLPLSTFPGIDKAVHVFAYGALAGAFLYGLQPFSHRADRSYLAVLVILFGIAHGIGDEFHQSFIPGRFVSLLDLSADALGTLVIVWYWLRK